MQRITFFVESAERKGSSWRVTGEVGLGPIREGDVFTFVHHQDTAGEVEVAAVVDEVGDSHLLLSMATPVEVRRGDILGAELSDSRRA